MNLNINLNIAGDRNFDSEFTNRFIKELREAISKIMKEGKKMNDKNTELEEYNLYEKKKVFLDNKSKNGKELVWIMDENSVCISENGDGGPVSINEINLPENKQVGQVYEKISNKYIYNEEMTNEINRIETSKRAF